MVQIIVRRTFTTTRVHVKRQEKELLEEFNIINKTSAIFISFLSDDTAYKKQMAQFQNVL